MRLHKKYPVTIFDENYVRQVFEFKYKIKRKNLRKLQEIPKNNYHPKNIEIFKRRVDNRPSVKLSIGKKIDFVFVEMLKRPKIKLSLDKKCMKIVKLQCKLVKKPLYLAETEIIRERRKILIDFDFLNHVKPTEKNENTTIKGKNTYKKYSINLYNSNNSDIVGLSIKYQLNVFYEKSSVCLRSNKKDIHINQVRGSLEEYIKNL